MLSLALAFFLLVTLTGIFGLTAFYRPGNAIPLIGRLAEPWNFTPANLGEDHWIPLCLASMLCLFLEMLMIRWMASEVSALAHFKNVVLIACFFGFGLGCYLCRRAVNWLAFLFPLCLLAVLIKLPWQPEQAMIRQIPYFISRLSEAELMAKPTAGSVWGMAAASLVITLLFGLVAFTFVPLGQLVGNFLESAQGIGAYTVNLLAGMAGIVLYTALCFFYQPPAIWFGCAGILTVALIWKIPRLRWLSAVAFLLCIFLTTIGPAKPAQELWSPYQKITLTPLPDERNPSSYELMTNDSWYQQIFNLSPQFASAHAELFRSVPLEWNAYNVPYRFYPSPASVLVLGAGTGNDVAAALRNGSRQVVAVEIDPLILQIGRDLHFERPYQSPKVRTVVEDARSYIQNSHERFDLIVFSLLDSHTTSSSFSNIRIDNYVYTLESLQAAKRLLRPDGIFIIKFWVNTPWIAGRLLNLMTPVFSKPPLMLYAFGGNYTTPGWFFVAGSEARIQQALKDPAIHSYVRQIPPGQTSTVVPTTDDWPYFYQRSRKLPSNVIALSLLLMAFCWELMRRSGAGPHSVQPHFFFLGAAFMLLECQIVSKMALLFGTTWMVNSVVVGGLLILIVAANLLVQSVPRIPFAIAYAGLFLTLLVTYWIPLERFLFPSLWLKIFAATTVLCLPVFFAGIVFIRSFARVGFAAEALGSNLLGAVIGGLLESVSLWTGIRSLLVLTAILYAASLLSLAKPRAAVAHS